MSEYTCPQCKGGFPEPQQSNGMPMCPWCGESLNARSKTRHLRYADTFRNKLRLTVNNTTSEEPHVQWDEKQ